MGIFIVGGFGAYLSTLIVRPPGGAFQVTVPLAVGFAAGGLVGLLLARYIKGVIVFLTGGMLGILVGTQGMSLIGQRPDTLLAAGLAVVFGLAAIRFEEIVLIISTSFVGAAAIMYGVTQMVTINPILAAVAFFWPVSLGLPPSTRTPKTCNHDNVVIGCNRLKVTNYCRKFTFF